MKPWPNLHKTFINTFNIAFASCLFGNVSDNRMAGYIVIYIYGMFHIASKKNYSLSFNQPHIVYKHNIHILNI